MIYFNITMKNLKLYVLPIIASAMMLGVGAQSKTTETSAIKLRGVVVDSLTREPVAGATVIIDSTTNGVLTNEKGEFNISGLKKNVDNFMIVEFMGYAPYKLKYNPVKNNNVMTYYVKLQQSAIAMEEAVIQGEAVMAKQIGDTTQYNAAAFKTNPDATASDLLEKMPGFKVEDGKAEAQGEAITRVYVDGKNFFKDNPTTALATLPADAVESIQLYDDKSDRAKFTGTDDGQRMKTINIVTKAKKNSMGFGDFSAGYGTDDRYSAKADVTLFKEKDRFSFGGGVNNINQSTLWGNRRFYSRGGSAQNVEYGAKFNYSTEIKKKENKTELGVDYTFTNKNTKNLSSSSTYYFPTANYGERLNDAISANNSVNTNHNASLNLESTLGTKNKIFFRPRVSFSNSASNGYSNSISNIDNILSNTSNTRNHNDNNSYDVSGSLSWYHNFNDKNFITFDASASFSDSDYDNIMIGSTGFVRNNQWVDSLINQNANNASIGNNVGFNVGYTYAISKASKLDFSYNIGYNWSDADKKVYLYDPNTNEYSEISEFLSNRFDRDYLNNKIRVNYNYLVDGKINFSIGAGYKNSDQQNNQSYPIAKRFNYNYNFSSPEMDTRLMLFISKMKYFTVGYNGSSNPPSITSLQDVINNDNPLFISKGNPNLKQVFNNDLYFGYNANNIEKNTSFNLYGNISNTINNVSTDSRFMLQDTVIDGVSVQRGAQFSTPVNLSGYWNFSIGGHYSFALKAIKSNFNVGFNYSYNRNPSLYNGDLYKTVDNGANIFLRLTSNISENIDFTLRSFTRVSNAVSNTNGGIRNINNNVTGNAGVMLDYIFFKGFFVNLDYSYDYKYYSKNAPENPNSNLLNAAIGKKFLKSKNAEIRISAFDILNQRKSYSHNVGANSITDSRTNIIKRYFMLSLSYKFNTMKGNSPQGQGSGMPMVRGAGMMMNRMH